MARFIALAVFLLCGCCGAEDWGPAQFLIGQWTGEGGGQPGQGGGAFSFTPDVQGKVLVRRSYAEYPASDGKPAYRHEDLTVVYRDETSRELRAIYFDNEDHVIRYSVKAWEGGVVFVSDGLPSAPRYRLTYTGTGKDRLKIKFEVAAPNRDFTTYLEAAARRDSAATPK